jgi:uncharacterized membrane protein (UPF0127 family)
MMRGVATIAALAACHRPRADPAPVVDIHFDDITVRAEVVADEASRERGLMFRRELPENAGMLFAFADDVRPTFSMKDTFIPLSVACLDASHHVVEITEDLEPFSTAGYRPAAPIRFAVEVNQGSFARDDVSVGQLVVFQLNDVNVE